LDSTGERGRYSLLILVAVLLTCFIENFLRSAPSALSSIYGVLVDATGNYGASNALILASNVLMILTYIFLIGESYGKGVEIEALVRED